MISYHYDEPNIGGFTVSYRELQNHYEQFVNMTDEQFVAKLPSALHFACVVAWFKELGTDYVLCDKGLIHEMVHVLEHGNDGATVTLHELRDQFKKVLYLA